MNILTYSHFYFVGIKGVAMTSLAQCLIDAGKTVQGSDLAEAFVTQPLLDRLQIHLDEGFSVEIPADIDCVVYTSAHQGKFNSQVVEAQKRSIPTFSQAEAIASLFNDKKGIAVCGVGGKSTTSAMIAWILEKTGNNPSYSIGVGNIPGLDRTGKWVADSEYFVAEADEYVIDPSAPSRGEAIIPRFSFMKPCITICTNLKFDHPDVYQNFEHTKTVYQDFFLQIQNKGTLVVNDDDKPLVALGENVRELTKGNFAGAFIRVTCFGSQISADCQLLDYEAHEGKTQTHFLLRGKKYSLALQIPGKFNVMNALAAIVGCEAAGVDAQAAADALADFRSTMRRSEFIGEKNGALFYDDYAHHPNEVEAVIRAFREWFPQRKLIVAFQSHTFSRTKALFDQFVESFTQADEVLMIDIFASARESFDATVSSDSLCDAIQQKYPQLPAQNLHTIEGLAAYLKEHIQTGDVCLTVGAGDIYKVHALI